MKALGRIQSEGGGEWQEGNSERNRDKSFQVL